MPIFYLGLLLELFARLVDFFARLLERLHARSPFAAYLVALLIAAVCTITLALLNQDGTSVVSIPVRTA